MEIERQGAFLLGLAVIVATLAIAYLRLSSVLSQTDQVLSVWEYIAETPVLCNHVGRIFTIFMKVRNPFSRAIDFRITSLEVGRCSGELKRRRKSDGPFRCTHGVALNLFAETLAGLAVFSRLGPKGKGILLKSETEYLKKAKGTVTGFAAFDPDEKDHTLGQVKCDVAIKDDAGTVIAKCVLTFKVEGMEIHNMRA